MTHHGNMCGKIWIVYWVSFLTLTAVRVVFAESIEVLFAAVTSFPLHIFFTTTLSCNHPQVDICVAITDSTIQRTHWVAVTSCRRKVQSLLSVYGYQRSSTYGSCTFEEVQLPAFPDTHAGNCSISTAGEP